MDRWELGTPKLTLECKLSMKETRARRWMLWAVGMSVLVMEREETTTTTSWIRVWICIRLCRAFYFYFFEIDFDFTNSI